MQVSTAPVTTEAPSTRFAKDQLKATIERIERLEEEKKTISDDIREVYSEAKGNGFDVKALRQIVPASTPVAQIVEPAAHNSKGVGASPTGSTKNEEALRGLRARPPSDLHGPAGQRHRMTLDELSEQTRLLRERLEYLASEPVEPRQRRTYRDIQPGTGVIR